MADVLGSAALSSAGLHTTGVSLEIGLSFVDVAFAGVSIHQYRIQVL